VGEALQRKHEVVDLGRVCGGVHHLPSFSIVDAPLVTIIIPTRNEGDLLRQCLNSLRLTEYPNVEILVIDNQSDDPQTLNYLEELKSRRNHQVVSYPHPFNYAAMHNSTVPSAHGDYICLLNNDTEVLAPRWLDEMLGQAQRAGVGAVGAKLLYPDGTVQHGGVILGIGGIGGHAHKNIPADCCGYFSRAALVQNFSAVTGACLLLRKSHWELVGGMAPDLPVAYNDVDLCLRLQEADLRNVWLPQALLYHHESKSRGSDTAPEKIYRFSLEHAYMQWRWGNVLKRDRFYNPNLTLEREDFTLSWPPRVKYPWRQEATRIDVPYGLPNLKTKALVLAPGEELQGSFPIPVGICGILTGLSILIGNYGGLSNGILVLRLSDDDGHTAHSHVPLRDSHDNSMLSIAFTSTQGEILLQGQDRMSFQIRLEDATHPVALRAYPLNDRWGHQIPGHEDCALRIELQVMERGS
jgi:GT2 family glycosyltransferase